MNTGSILLLLLSGVWNARATNDTISVDSILLTLIDQAEVTARESGVVASVRVTEGQIVTEGDVLAQIDDSEARLAKQRAELALNMALAKAENDVLVRAAQKTWEVAKAELKRATESIASYKKSVSATELDRLKLTADRAALEIEQAQLDLKTARLTAQLKQNELDLATLKLEQHTIRAPIEGVVVQMNKKKGEWVQPGDVVLRIVRINRLRVECFLNADQIVDDLTNHAVTLTVDLPGKPQTQFPGSIVFVSPEINPVNGQVRVWAEIDNAERTLRPGLRGSIQIDASHRHAQKQND